MTWIPPWYWFVSPSGGPVKPGFWGFVDGIKRRPVVAHPVGAAIVVVVFRLVLQASAVAAVGAALLAEGVNQFYKAIRGVYGPWLWREVGWRMALALLGATVALLVGCASPTEPQPCYRASAPIVNATGDSTGVVTTEWCVYVGYMP